MDGDIIANIVDPDQTAALRMFVHACVSENFCFIQDGNHFMIMTVPSRQNKTFDKCQYN